MNSVCLLHLPSPFLDVFLRLTLPSSGISPPFSFETRRVLFSLSFVIRKQTGEGGGLAKLAESEMKQQFPSTHSSSTAPRNPRRGGHHLTRRRSPGPAAWGERATTIYPRCQNQPSKVSNRFAPCFLRFRFFHPPLSPADRPTPSAQTEWFLADLEKPPPPPPPFFRPTNSRKVAETSVFQSLLPLR